MHLISTRVLRGHRRGIKADQQAIEEKNHFIIEDLSASEEVALGLRKFKILLRYHACIIMGQVLGERGVPQLGSICHNYVHAVIRAERGVRKP
jgi:hypothetical protein